MVASACQLRIGYNAKPLRLIDFVYGSYTKYMSLNQSWNICCDALSPGRAVLALLHLFAIWGLGLRVEGLGLRVEGSGCRVQGSGCGVQG